jgi:hypothetical protein
VTNWLPEVYTLVAEGRNDAAIDRVFGEIDDLLLGGAFSAVDDILLEVELAKLNTTLLVGFLTITFAAKTRLFGREDFVRRVEQRLLVLAPDRIDGLLRGLR